MGIHLRVFPEGGASSLQRWIAGGRRCSRGDRSGDSLASWMMRSVLENMWCILSRSVADRLPKRQACFSGPSGLNETFSQRHATVGCGLRHQKCARQGLKRRSIKPFRWSELAIAPESDYPATAALRGFSRRQQDPGGSPRDAPRQVGAAARRKATCCFVKLCHG